ncbi:MAG: hypothetical protein GEU28_08590, partial [Dehalococcoidia bacterium]|nr:hypothetical protein [Dehalococcoidia bacterium]
MARGRMMLTAGLSEAAASLPRRALHAALPAVLAAGRLLNPALRRLTFNNRWLWRRVDQAYVRLAPLGTIISAPAATNLPAIRLRYREGMDCPRVGVVPAG